MKTSYVVALIVGDGHIQLHQVNDDVKARLVFLPDSPKSAKNQQS
jgi:hypothetical protein